MQPHPLYRSRHPSLPLCRGTNWRLLRIDFHHVSLLCAFLTAHTLHGCVLHSLFPLSPPLLPAWFITSVCLHPLPPLRREFVLPVDPPPPLVPPCSRAVWLTKKPRESRGRGRSNSNARCRYTRRGSPVQRLAFSHHGWHLPPRSPFQSGADCSYR